MSSKRGRKRNDNLPPNRARDVQRAFRARRAAHLQALEQRVTELEEENTFLRHSLGFPPANRPPLGKGPTGKDRPKSFNDSLSHVVMGLHSSRESSCADSPASRESSLSPSAMTVAMPSRSVHAIDSHAWDNALLMTEEPEDIPGPSDSSYQLAPMSTPLPERALQFQAPYSSSVPSSSRKSMSNSVYQGNSFTDPQSSDRPMGSGYNGQSFTVRGEIHEDTARQQFGYHHSPFQTHDSNMHSETPPPNPSPLPSQPHLQTDPPLTERNPQQHTQHQLHTPHHTPSSQQQISHHSHLHPQQNVHHSHHNHPHRESPPYQKRYISGEQNFSIGQGFSQLSNSTRPQHPTQHHDNCSQPQDSVGNDPSTSSRTYGPDGRLNVVP